MAKAKDIGLDDVLRELRAFDDEITDVASHVSWSEAMRILDRAMNPGLGMALKRVNVLMGRLDAQQARARRARKPR